MKLSANEIKEIQKLFDREEQFQIELIRLSFLERMKEILVQMTRNEKNLDPRALTTTDRLIKNAKVETEKRKGLKSNEFHVSDRAVDKKFSLIKNAPELLLAAITDDCDSFFAECSGLAREDFQFIWFVPMIQ